MKILDFFTLGLTKRTDTEHWFDKLERGIIYWAKSHGHRTEANSLQAALRSKTDEFKIQYKKSNKEKHALIKTITNLLIITLEATEKGKKLSEKKVTREEITEIQAIVEHAIL